MSRMRARALSTEAYLMEHNWGVILSLTLALFGDDRSVIIRHLPGVVDGLVRGNVDQPARGYLRVELAADLCGVLVR